MREIINLFHATGLFQYPLKTRGFLMFWGTRKKTNGMKWVTWGIYTKTVHIKKL